MRYSGHQTHVRQALLSESNPLLKDVRRAAARGSVTAQGLAVAEGFHLLEEALRSHCEIPVVIVAESAQEVVSKHLRGLQHIRVAPVSEKAFASLATTESPQGVIALVRPATWTLEHLLRGKPLLVVLDSVQDPGNAGAIVRAAEAFGATGAAFLRGSVNPYNPKCLRASAGSTFRLPVLAGLEQALLAAALKQKQVTLYAALPRASRSLAETDLKGSCAIVIGSEGRGVTPSLAESAAPVRIPTCGVESLNAAVAAGVLLYEAQRQRQEEPSASAKRSPAPA